MIEFDINSQNFVFVFFVWLFIKMIVFLKVNFVKNNDYYILFIYKLDDSGCVF